MKITPEQMGTTETIGYDPKKSPSTPDALSGNPLQEKDKLIKIGCIVIGVILLIIIIYRMGTTPADNTTETTEAVTTVEVTEATDATDAPATSEAETSEEISTSAPETEAEAEQTTSEAPVETEDGEDTEVIVETPPTTPR